MRTLAEDTHPNAERVLIELLRGAAPARKMSMVPDDNRTARMLALTVLQERHPEDSPHGSGGDWQACCWSPSSLPGLMVLGQPKSEADTELLAATFLSS
jgi:hypothetical protein